MKTSNQIPYNLQMFAEGESPDADNKPEVNDSGKQEVKDNPGNKEDKYTKGKEKDGNNGNDGTPDVQELLTRIAKLERAKDKATSEAAEFKRQLREKMTEQERASEEKAEAEAEREEYYKNIERENKIYKIKSTYQGLGYTPDEAQRIAEAEADNDFDEKTKIMSEVEARKKKQMEAEFLASRPEINAGSGSDVLTKEKFDQMNMVEKSQLFKNDPDTYKKLRQA